MALIAAGFGALGLKEFDRALDYFRTVCQRKADPRFFLDWYWQSIGKFGLARTLVARGEIAEAAEQAEQLRQAAQHNGDAPLRAFTWELHAQIAIARREWTCGLEHLERAFAVKGAPQIPMVAWRLHVTAAELHMALGDAQQAEQHRATAAAILMRLAHSLGEGEPLRESLLAVPSWFERPAAPLARIMRPT
jgi:ATP/maltotriose-dependent transcriptional regulator MalT